MNKPDKGEFLSAPPASQRSRGGLARLAVIGPSGSALARLRGGLIRAASAQGCPVLALAPGIDASDSQDLLARGAQVKNFSLSPDRFTFRPGRRVIANLSERLSGWNPHTVLVTGREIIVPAVLAARHAKVPFVAALVSEVPATGLASRTRTALRSVDLIIAHNRQDEAYVRKQLADAAVAIVRVPGTGADLSVAAGMAMPKADEPLLFLALSRLDRAKGVNDYLEAARIARTQGINARFMLAGAEGHEPGAVKRESLTRYADCVQYLGNVSDAVQAIQQAHVFVAPSHVEGMPPAVLTALAASRPIVVTDIPGSRETVDEMVNGTIVPPSDPAALAEGFRRLDRNRALLATMALASRSKAERIFPSQQVEAILLKALRLA